MYIGIPRSRDLKGKKYQNMGMLFVYTRYHNIVETSMEL